MIRYKFDVLAALKKAGYSSYRIRKEKIMGESLLTQMRRGVPVLSDSNLSLLCSVLHCGVGDLLEYVPDE